MGRRRKQTEPSTNLRDLASLANGLAESSKLDSEFATEAAVLAVIEALRHLDELRERMINGTIASDERRAVSALASSVYRGLALLGLDAQLPPELGDL